LNTKGQKENEKNTTEIIALQHLLQPIAVELSQDTRLLPIRVNTAKQRTMKAPLAVSAGTDDGKGLIAAFQLDEAGEVFDFHTYREIDASEIDWPLRMKIEAADGESVTGIIRAHPSQSNIGFFPIAGMNHDRKLFVQPCFKTK
jgi:hypothetical protein